MTDRMDAKLGTLVRDLVELSPPPPGVPIPPRHGRRPRPRLIASVAVGLLVVAALVAVVMTRRQPASISVSTGPSAEPLAECRSRNPRGQLAEYAAPSMVNALNPHLSNPGLQAQDIVLGRDGLWLQQSQVLQRTPSFDVQSDTWTLRKFAWFRTSTNRLTIQGRRLDGPGTFRATHPPDVSYPVGFMPSELTFSTGGCWRITAQLGKTTVAFFFAFSSSRQALCSSVAGQLAELAPYPEDQGLAQTLKLAYQAHHCP